MRVVIYKVHFMEGSAATRTMHRDPATVRVTRVGLLIASLGALLVAFNPFGIAVAGLVLGVLGAIIAARGGLGHNWYWALAAGAALMFWMSAPERGPAATAFGCAPNPATFGVNCALRF